MRRDAFVRSTVKGILVAAACGLVAASCMGPAQPSTPAGSAVPTSADATAAARATAAPKDSPVACRPFDLAADSQPSVELSLASAPELDEAWGLNGSGVLGDRLFDVGRWHQPSPGSAVDVAPSEALTVRALLGTDFGELPVCVASATVDAAPFSTTGIAPDEAALIRLASSSSQPSAVGVRGPAQPGEWVVRVVLQFATTPGPSTQETFFRLRVDTQGPAVGGRVIDASACVAPDTAPPRVLLQVDGAAGVVAAPGSGTWRYVSADGPAPLGPRVDAPPNSKLVITIAGGICAGWWTVALAPKPTSEGRWEPFRDLVPERGDALLNPGHATAFELDRLPQGDWSVAAFLEFADGDGTLIGQTSSFWNVVVP